MDLSSYDLTQKKLPDLRCKINKTKYFKRKIKTNKLTYTPSTSDSSHWSNNLLNAVHDPNQKLEEDNELIVLQDKYPKAKHHFLILPKENILNVKCLRINDLSLIEKMERKGKDYADYFKSYENTDFLIGYHAVPSMQRLHLHVISTDFDSPHLRTSHHWNTFNTPYFLSSSAIRNELIQIGEIQYSNNDYLKYLSRELLQCNKCYYKTFSIYELKAHIKTHGNIGYYSY